ncbi:hypothetical protein NQ315_001604 [Exocentrus adspersus]|uniref:Uncharacterized protein n=1 Tax=Exocentrus adspersus TaxID=1586481 RepID=A0AAV8WA14_9CUCU|nr:hypothetical protein NQ315_001604 [Exocentrus adspersus]
MSQYVTPFLVLNLGSEMIFVIAQRLQAQCIPHERATLVLEEIISVLISKPLIVDLMKPQATHDHDSVRQIIEDVTQSSVMRLDPVSMGKLWDLITMVFKWQISMSSNLIGITLRHLYEIESYIINPDTHQQLLRVQSLVENFNKILVPKEKEELHRDVLMWLKDCNVRVSLLLRMGLQNADGKFVVNNLDPVAEEMLKNLGENVYHVTQNGRILENRGKLTAATTCEPEPVNELQLFVNEMLSHRKLNDSSEGNRFKLRISDENANRTRENKKVAFDTINVNVDNKLQNLMSDLVIKDEEEVCFKKDLLSMLNGNDNK